MADRGMFSKRIINSAKFLKMPVSSQNLYFHLSLNADDDGVVEAFQIMKLTGAHEDDLRVLISKDFIRLLNDDMVAIIMDWTEHNHLRADRKVDSIYKDLIVRVIPDIMLIEAKERADTGKKTGKKTGNGRPLDCIGKDRIGKVSIDNKSIINTSVKEVIAEYHKLLTDHKVDTSYINYSILTKSIKSWIKDIDYKKIIECMPNYFKDKWAIENKYPLSAMIKNLHKYAPIKTTHTRPLTPDEVEQKMKESIK
jgi:hypothetical protein